MGGGSAHVQTPPTPRTPARSPCAPRSKLDRKMTDAFHSIWTTHKQKNIPLRVAAFVVALQRVTRAEIHRGFD